VKISNIQAYNQKREDFMKIALKMQQAKQSLAGYLSLNYTSVTPLD